MFTPQDLGFDPVRFPAYRQQQLETAIQIVQAFDDTPYVLLCAPPGSGKSLIYQTVQRLLDIDGSGARSLTLTVNKSLQTQLVTDFPDTYSIVGHSNYPCANVSRNSSGGIDDFDCDARVHNTLCDYADVAIPESLKCNSVVSNIAHRITIGRSEEPNRLGAFDLLVCDEAHLIRDNICGLLSVKIYERKLSQVLGVRLPSISDSVQEWASWSMSVIDKCNRLIAGKSPDARYARNLTRELTRFIECVSVDPRWVVMPEDPTYYGYNVTLKPLWAESYTRQYLYYDIPHTLLCSATLTHDTAKGLGLQPADYTLIEMDSVFDVRRRPFYVVPELKVDYNTMSEDRNRHELVSAIDRFASVRQDRKGLIHSVSYKYAEMVCGLSSRSHEMISHTRSDGLPTAIVNHHDTPPPSILVSPSIGTGHDFAEEDCRYQVLLKVPRKDSKDVWIVARRKNQKGYDRTETAQTILQNYGRAMRRTTGWGETVIFDEYMTYMPAALFPMYFRRAWQTFKRGQIVKAINF